VVQKRYSDFVTLHQSLTALVGDQPPAPLPAKSWLRSTVSSPELTEHRRAGLEIYLRSIAETPDRRWRDTPAWRAFLNLPGGGTSAASTGGSSRIPAIGLRDADAAAASDPATWLDLHRELKGALHDARLFLARRDATAPADTVARAEASGAAKRSLVRAGGLLASLNDGLRMLKDGGRLGEGELRRRRDLLSAARVEREGLEKLSASLAAAGGAATGGDAAGSSSGTFTGDKAALLGGSRNGGPRAGGRVLGAPLPETEQTRELDNEGVLQLQRQIMEDQDQDVEALAAIVRRQKEMGMAIREEVDRHIIYMDSMNDDADRLAGKVKVAKDRVKRLN
jgi:regulator of vacuolar morphogenesis